MLNPIKFNISFPIRFSSISFFSTSIPPSDSWSHKPFNNIEIYNDILNSLVLSDTKQSKYYLDLYQLFFDASKARSGGQLLSIQKKIDNLFLSSDSLKSNPFSEAIQISNVIVLDILKVISSDIDLNFLDYKLYSHVVLTEMFKIFHQSKPVEEMVIRRAIVRRLLQNNYLNKASSSFKISNNFEMESNLHNIVSITISTIILKTDWWLMNSTKLSNKNTTTITPQKDAFNLFKYDAQYVSIDLPRIICCKVTKYNVLHKSYKNSGETIINDSITNVINDLGKVPYIINKELYAWLCDNKDLWYNKLPSFSDLYNLKNSYAYKLIHKKADKIRLHNNILNTASLLLPLKAFYIPCYMDWRGRIYAKSEYINYQSDKLSLALIQFKNGVKIGASGILSLKLYGAGLYGVGISNKYKLEWIDKNHDNIISLRPEFICKAKNIPLFVAFSLEYINCMKSNKPTDFLTHLPVLIDATCSGLQHLSSMIADVNIGRAVNLKKYHAVQDLYNNIAHTVNVNLKLDFNLDRSFVKKIIMCIPYNVSQYTAAQYFIEAFEYNPRENKFYPPNKPDILISYKDLYVLSQKVYKTFYMLHPKMKELVDYFKNIAHLLSEFNCPIMWSTPAGLTINQNYKKFETIQIKGPLDTRKISLKIPTNQISIKDQANALMPNIIHSFDGANIIKAYELFSQVDRDIFTIHDCYAAHATYINDLQTAVKQSFINMYIRKDFIDNFHNLCLTRLQNYDPSVVKIDYEHNKVFNKITGKSYNIPVKPKMGDLNISEIINSKYMVH